MVLKNNLDLEWMRAHQYLLFTLVVLVQDNRQRKIPLYSTLNNLDLEWMRAQWYMSTSITKLVYSCLVCHCIGQIAAILVGHLLFTLVVLVQDNLQRKFLLQ